MNYTYGDLADMHLMYGPLYRNGQEVRGLNHEQFTIRRYPKYSIFANIDSVMWETSLVTKSKTCTWTGGTLVVKSLSHNLVCWIRCPSDHLSSAMPMCGIITLNVWAGKVWNVRKGRWFEKWVRVSTDVTSYGKCNQHWPSTFFPALYNI